MHMHLRKYTYKNTHKRTNANTYMHMRKHNEAQSAGTVEYTDYFSPEE